MIIDALLQFSNAQAITTTTFATNVVDLTTNRDIGSGEASSVAFIVNTSFAGLTSLAIQLVSANDAALSSGLTVLSATGAIPVTALAAGREPFGIAVPRTISTALGQRYLGLRYIVVGTGTAGAITANLVLGGIADIRLFTASTPIL